MRRLAVFAALAAAACSSASEEAERRYEFLKANGAGDGELCKQAEQVAQLAASDGDSMRFRLWRVTAEMHCDEEHLRKLK